MTEINTEEVRKIWLTDTIGTHYEQCWKNHYECCIFLLCDIIDQLDTSTINEYDHPEDDCIDFSHPAYYRGFDYAVEYVTKIVEDIIDNPKKRKEKSNYDSITKMKKQLRKFCKKISK